MNYKHTCFGLLVDDVQEAIDFYTNTMGYKIHEKNHDGVTFSEFVTGGPVVLFVWQWDHLCEHLGMEVMSQVKNRTQSAIYFDNPDDVDRAYEELKAKGIHFLTEPKNWPWHARAAYFLDHDGNMWEIYSGDAHPEGT